VIDFTMTVIPLFSGSPVLADGMIGSAMIIINGQVVAQGSQFSLYVFLHSGKEQNTVYWLTDRQDVEVVTATVDVNHPSIRRSSWLTLHRSRLFAALEPPNPETFRPQSSHHMVNQQPHIISSCWVHVLTALTERIEVEMSLSSDAEDVDPRISPSRPIEVHYHLPEEEIAFGPACWLWDYVSSLLLCSSCFWSSSCYHEQF
jgi:NAD+ synthase (glutamine-hydrolysing)